jgi:hypothetical protein
MACWPSPVGLVSFKIRAASLTSKKDTSARTLGHSFAKPSSTPASFSRSVLWMLSQNAKRKLSAFLSTKLKAIKSNWQVQTL